jgi:microcystin-dependent protein
MTEFKSDTIETESPYSYIPVGGIVTIGGPFSEYSDTAYVDLGLIPCDGRTLNTSTNPEYSSLFSVIGTLYGGTGATSFQVPNLKNDKISIAGTSNTFHNTNTVGTRVSSIAHSHSASATNNSFSMNSGNTSHDHTLSYNDVGNVTGENGHSHSGVSSSGTIGSNVQKNGPAGTAGGGLNGNHSHNVSLNSNNLEGGGGNNHIHSGVLFHNTGYNSAVPHTHGASITNSANTGSATYSSPSTLGVPYANVIYFIKA